MGGKLDGPPAREPLGPSGPSSVHGDRIVDEGRKQSEEERQEVPPPDRPSYEERRRRARRSYSIRPGVLGNFYLVECPHCALLIPTKDKGYVPPHVRGSDPAARCPGARLWEREES